MNSAISGESDKKENTQELNPTNESMENVPSRENNQNFYNETIPNSKNNNLDFIKDYFTEKYNNLLNGRYAVNFKLKDYLDYLM
jgi:hypothetical protein